MRRCPRRGRSARSRGGRPRTGSRARGRRGAATAPPAAARPVWSSARFMARSRSPVSGHPGLRSLHMSRYHRVVARPTRQASIRWRTKSKHAQAVGRRRRRVGRALAVEDPVVDEGLARAERRRLDGVVQRQRVDHEVRLVDERLLERLRELREIEPAAAGVAHLEATGRALLPAGARAARRACPAASRPGPRRTSRRTRARARLRRAWRPARRPGSAASCSATRRPTGGRARPRRSGAGRGRGSARRSRAGAGRSRNSRAGSTGSSREASSSARPPCGGPPARGARSPVETSDQLEQQQAGRERSNGKGEARAERAQPRAHGATGADSAGGHAKSGR